MPPVTDTKLDSDFAATPAEDPVPADTDSLPLLVGDPIERERVRSSVARRLLGDGLAQRIGRFHVLRSIGSGGMGTVYAAYDEQLDRRVALKVIRGDHRDGHDRTLREAQALASLSHPNVVPIYEVGLHDGRLFIAMEFVKGETLRAWLRASPRGWRETVAMFRQAAEGLAAAHDAGLVHRDFKPDNAIVGSDGRVRVLDFGLARRDTGEQSPVDHHRPIGDTLLDTPLTHTGAVMGTPAYMAAEQFLGDPVDARTDQFALCVALYEGLYGERPFAGATAEMLGAAVTRGDVRAASRAAVPGWLRAVVVRGLRPDRKDRWPSTRALIDALGNDPARRRTRIATALGIGALGLGIWGGTRVLEHRRAAACDEEAASIESVWNHQSRDDVRTAMAETSLIGAANYERAMPWIETWVASWSTARRETCSTGTLESADLQARSGVCFAERRDELATLVDDLQSGSTIAVREAVAAAASLTAVAQCTDPVWLARWPFPPTELHASVEEQRHAMRELETMYREGRYREAFTRASEVVAATEALGWAPLVAEAKLQQGRVGVRIAEPGAQDLIEAAFLEAGAIGYDDLAANAARRLVAATSLDRATIDDALRWGRVADMLMTRLGEPETSPGRGILAVNLGNAYDMIDDAPRAEAELEKAAAIWRESLGPDHPDIGVALTSLARLLLGRGDLERAEPIAQQAVDLAERSLGPDHPRTGHALTTLGRIQGERGDRRGITTLARVLETRERTTPDEHPAIIESLVDLGAIHMNFGEASEAAAYAERALVLTERERPDDVDGISVVLNNLGNAKLTMGDHDGAIAALERAAAIDEARDPTSVSTATTLLNLGGALGEAGQAAKALAQIDRAGAILERKLGADHINVALADINAAEALLALGDAAAALPRAERALAVIEATLGGEHRHTVSAIAIVAHARERAD